MFFKNLKNTSQALACTAAYILVWSGAINVLANDYDARILESQALVNAYGLELKTALVNAMAAGGPVEAVEICKDQAPLIAAKLSRQSGAKVSRVSKRFRNPTGVPESWQKPVLEKFASSQIAEQALDEHVEQHESGLRYMKAIRIQPLCLVCHGKTLSSDVAAALDDDYPHDQARGYALGDLRGAFSVSWPTSETTATANKQSTQ